MRTAHRLSVGTSEWMRRQAGGGIDYLDLAGSPATSLGVRERLKQAQHVADAGDLHPGSGRYLGCFEAASHASPSAKLSEGVFDLP